MIGVRSIPLQTDFRPVAWPHTGLMQVIWRCHEHASWFANNKGWRSCDRKMGQAGQNDGKCNCGGRSKHVCSPKSACCAAPPLREGCPLVALRSREVQRNCGQPILGNERERLIRLIAVNGRGSQLRCRLLRPWSCTPVERSPVTGSCNVCRGGRTVGS
jgi:hypothetical protein